MHLPGSTPFVQSKYRRELSTTHGLTHDLNRVASLGTVLANVTNASLQGGISKSKEADLLIVGQGCRDVLQTLNDILTKNDILATAPQGIREKTLKVWKRFKLDQQEIEKLRARITSNTTLLNAFLASLAR
jgi:hypothetical protein